MNSRGAWPTREDMVRARPSFSKAWLHEAFLKGRDRLQRAPLAQRVARGAFWSLVGTALSRVLGLAATVVTARVLGKEQFGALGVLTSTIGLFQVFAGFGIGATSTKFVAELRVKDPGRAGRILALSGVLSANFGVFAALLLYTISPWLSVHFLKAPLLVNPMRIASVGLFFSTMGGAQGGALAGFEAFRTIATTNAIAALTGVPLAVVGVYYFGLSGAVAATVLTSAIQWILTHIELRRHARRAKIYLGVTGWTKELQVLWSFSLPALIAGALVAPVNWISTALLVNAKNGFAEMGAFNAANQWFGAIMLLPSIMGSSLLPVLSERLGEGDRDSAARILRTLMLLNTVVVLPVGIALSLASGPLMGLYGTAFEHGWPTMVAALATASLLAVVTPAGVLLVASNKLWLGFLMNAGWAVVFISTTVLFTRWGWGAFGVALARLLAYGVHAAWTTWYALAVVRSTKRPVLV